MAPEPKSLAAQIMVASQGAAPKMAEVIIYLKPIAKPVRCRSRCHPPQPVGSATRELPIGFIATMIIDYCGPLYIKLFQLGYRAYHELPTDLLSALIGLGLSFCGGAYCASISAIEAVRMSGWDRTQSALEEIYTDACAMYEAYVADASTNADDDLLTRKLAVVAVACRTRRAVHLVARRAGRAAHRVRQDDHARREHRRDGHALPAKGKLGHRSGALTLTTDPDPSPAPGAEPEPDPNPEPEPGPEPETETENEPEPEPEP
eukprot:scaffold28110_cov71-Phaeocystis_antarctica.AAC.8